LLLRAAVTYHNRVSITPFEIDWQSVVSGGEPHEYAFSYLSQVTLDEPAVVIDVGANSGISALSVHFVQPSWPIISYEPNSALEPLLLKTKEFIEERGGTMQYRLVGLAAVSDTDMLFRIPVVDKVYDEVLTMGSFASGEFNSPHIRKYLSETLTVSGDWSGELKELRLPVRRFDDEPKPDGRFFFVKIDVEGFEVQVVKGMMTFIEQNKPALLIEIGEFQSLVEIEQDLRRFGYRPYSYDHLTGLLIRRQMKRFLAGVVNQSYNVFLIPDGSAFLPLGAVGAEESLASVQLSRPRVLELEHRHEARAGVVAARHDDERRRLAQEIQALYDERQVLYEERQTLYDERQILYDERQESLRDERWGPLRAGLIRLRSKRHKQGRR
jgi:FkbM family methyltransferase